MHNPPPFTSWAWDQAMGELIDGLNSKLELLMAFLILLILVGHINNLYNTCFWCLVQQSGLSADQAEERLNVSKADKSINYFCHFLGVLLSFLNRMLYLLHNFSEKSINNKDIYVYLYLYTIHRCDYYLQNVKV